MPPENLPFDEQRLGGSVGGPLVRDRSHFFASYERDNVDNVRVIALPASNPFAARENGVFPAEADNQMASARLDHRLGTAHLLSARYASDHQQSLRATPAGLSDSSQVDIFNRSHSLVVEETWSARQNVANAFRVHVLTHSLGTFPRDNGLAIRRPSVTGGNTNPEAWVVPVTRVTASDALYLHTPRSDFKVGGEIALATHDQDSHVYENGFFEFQTDAPFDAANRATWPTAYNQQKPATVTYRSQEIGLFAQYDWRLGNRIRLNTGLRYDIDLNLRLNDFYRQALDDPELPGPRPLHQPRSRHRHEQRAAAARRDVGQPRGRHADRSRRLGRVRHAEPPVVPDSLDESVREQRGPHHRSGAIAELPRYQRRPRRPQPGSSTWPPSAGGSSAP